MLYAFCVKGRITLMGDNISGRSRHGKGGKGYRREIILRFGGVSYAFFCEWGITLVGKDISGSCRHLGYE